MNSQNPQPQARHRRRLTPEQRRRIAQKRRMQKFKRQLTVLAPLLVAVIAAVILIVNIPDGKKDALDSITTRVPEQPLSTQAMPEVQAPVPTVQPTADASSVTAQMAAMGAQAEGSFNFDMAYVDALRGKTYGREITFDTSKIDTAKLNRWPEAQEGCLPILKKAANVDEKIICITVDDCFQADNLAEIVKLVMSYDGKITIFPIGEQMERDKTAQVIKTAWEYGMEIENHTYDHAHLYRHKDSYLTDQIWRQNARLSNVLGVNYQMHFFRPSGGDERYCQRVHAYCEQLGYNGLAMWTQTGSVSPMSELIEALAPGEIYLFHTTNNDLERLRQFVPAAAEAGYKFVTMNEMFGLPNNETSDLSTLGDEPAMESFKIAPTVMKKTMYLRAAGIVQKRLYDLGWLSAEPDGVFGNDSYMAIGYFQQAAGLDANGVADAATQMKLFADDAPHKS